MSKPREWAIVNEDTPWAGDCFVASVTYSIPRGSKIVLVEKSAYDELQRKYMLLDKEGAGLLQECNRLRKELADYKSQLEWSLKKEQQLKNQLFEQFELVKKLKAGKNE